MRAKHAGADAQEFTATTSAAGPPFRPAGTAVQCTRSFRFRDPECARSRGPFHRGRTGIAGFVVKIEYAQLVGQQAIRDCPDLVDTREQSLTPAANESFTTSKRPEPTRRLRRLRRSASRRIRRSDPLVINRGAAPLPRRVADLHRCWAAPLTGPPNRFDVRTTRQSLQVSTASDSAFPQVRAVLRSG